jgi:drug/metabolite transporter (DMT)-like permease
MIHILEKLFSESLLSLYPIFIKKIPLNIDLQLLTRLLGYSLIPLFFSSLIFIKGNLLNKSTLLLGLITIFHVYFSYEGFSLLETGVSYALFYTYPLMLIFWETKKFSIYYLSTILGIILLSIDFNSIIESKDKLKGIGFILLAAITEVMSIYLVKNIKTDNSWNILFLAYFPAFILFTIYFIFFKKNEIKQIINDKQIEDNKSQIKDKKYIIIALLFNIIIGVIGYFFRFKTAKLLNTKLFGILSFFGIFTSYIYGIFLDNEIINIQNIIGIGFIIFSNIMLL